MKASIISDNELREELGQLSGDLDVSWVSSVEEVTGAAEVIIDLLFEPARERIEKLMAAGALIIINDVVHKLADTNEDFIRINGWKTFLKGGIVEGSGKERHRELAENVFRRFDKKIEWVPDQTGFITPRVISMIINEAYFALDEKVSTKEEIDTAMKLGTNYPYGPFEWAEKIGLDKIHTLLTALSKENSRYTPSFILPL